MFKRMIPPYSFSLQKAHSLCLFCCLKQFQQLNVLCLIHIRIPLPKNLKPIFVILIKSQKLRSVLAFQIHDSPTYVSLDSPQYFKRIIHQSISGQFQIPFKSINFFQTARLKSGHCVGICISIQLCISGQFSSHSRRNICISNFYCLMG